ncbi:MAG: sulfatase [Planctomycetota bacterium]|jgi:arylsulfatase A-like enzyme
MGNKILCILTLTLIMGWACVAEAADKTLAPRNVLLICVDDLRPVLGSYGGAAKTPHLDRFARTAVQFDRHYVQFPSCGPSRACMMGGVRPDTAGIYGNGEAWKISKDPANRPTMPQHFLNHGYTTLSFGKTYHSKGAGKGYGWSRQPWHPPSGWTCYVEHKYEGKGTVRPAYEIYDGADALHGDYQTADMAIAAMRENRDRPFFIAVGFYKPHLPFVAPKRYWDLYDEDEIVRPGPPEIPEGAARHGYHFRELTTYGYRDELGMRLYTADDMPTDRQARELIRAYYAAVSFNDAQIGRLLAALDELGLSDNTAVAVWGDHGFHLGDQARWAKWTQFEADMRSPLMIRLPGAGQHGRATRALVESVDLYPTLVDYCGLPRPGHLEGESLGPLIRGEVESVKDFAMSQVTGLQAAKHMRAYSLRTARYRYVEWRDSSDGLKPTGRELYDLSSGLAERVNVAGDPAYREVLEACERMTREGYASLRGH